MANIIHDEQREADVQMLCNAVLNTSTEFYDNPNGAYESTCPFCGVIEHRGWENNHASIEEISHNSDCAYLIAKDLKTNL